ncbi:hypothetical protein VE03_01445 [Pseudogymnoascus sp. 23342-1-I1]|nr:hypothetical protein VE03_01445 [Pseudogymnoascus sp. 23342-1-I1]
MKNTAPFWASIALWALPVLAETTPTSPTATTSTAAASSCTASLVAELCDYKEPGPAFAVASSGYTHCWEYCNDHGPCDFVIFAATGNPYLGTGTCWVYPGETYDPSQGSSEGCNRQYLSVYSKPVCAEGPTPTGGACAATGSPSAVAKVCGYAPPETCFNTCIASSGAVNCLSACAQAESCAYAVFNPDPRYEANSPYIPGSCWVYTNGTFDAGATTTCAGDPEQYVYNNPCPKPKPSSISLKSSATAGSGSTGTAGAAPGSTSGAATGSDGTQAGGDTASSDGTAAGSAAGSDATGSANSAALSADGTDASGDTAGTTTIKKNAASAGLSITSPLAVGVAVLVCLAL